MRINQGHVLTLSLAAVFIFVGTQIGWPMGAEKWACFQDITLSISIDPENSDPELHLGVGLTPSGYKTALPRPILLLGKPFQDLIPSCLLWGGLKSRSPPILLLTQF